MMCVHAQTISKLVLPKGSLVCFGHHMPHYVAPITEQHRTRCERQKLRNCLSTSEG
eukprot:COSAG06_NODE_682_length_13115_cov_17.917793_13_plen_56_part_00